VFRTLFRIILILVVVGTLVWIFSPRIFNNAANTLLTSVDASIANAQGLAQYVPAAVTGQSHSGDLQVNLSGLQASTSYEITLDESQCGLVNKDLGGVTSDGGGTFYIELPLASLDTTQTWFVDVHQQGTQGPSVACGQLETNQDSGTQAVNASQSGPNIFGDSQPLPNNQSASSTGTPPSGLPNTGVGPDDGQSYNNSTYPRKY
jgi:hypothetical protein